MSDHGLLTMGALVKRLQDQLLVMQLSIQRKDEALRRARRAIGDHVAPEECYATGPLTGNDYLDLVQCPACHFLESYDEAIASPLDGDLLSLLGKVFVLRHNAYVLREAADRLETDKWAGARELREHAAQLLQEAAKIQEVMTNE